MLSLRNHSKMIFSSKLTQKSNSPKLKRWPMKVKRVNQRSARKERKERNADKRESTQRERNLLKKTVNPNPTPKSQRMRISFKNPTVMPPTLNPKKSQKMKTWSLLMKRNQRRRSARKDQKERNADKREEAKR